MLERMKCGHLHADNCVGQNKNKIMLQCLMWRVLMGRHEKITLSFLVVGHTKFAPDWCFGLFMRKPRRTKVEDIKQTVNNSTVSTTIKAQLVGIEDGTVVSTYDWKSYLKEFMQPLPGIKDYHHFQICTHQPGIIAVKRYYDDDKFETSPLLKCPTNLPHPDKLPPLVVPSGLDSKRQWYLYDLIREFCSDSHKDIVAPLPRIP